MMYAISVVLISSFCSSWCMLESWNMFKKLAKENPGGAIILPASFDDVGKFEIKKYISSQQEAAKMEPSISTGLAAIWNSVSADDNGVESIINDEESLKYANRYSKTVKESTYFSLIPTFDLLMKKDKGSPDFAYTVQVMMVSNMFYDKLLQTSDIGMRMDDRGTNFQGNDIRQYRKILEDNAPIDAEKNKHQAQGALMCTAYYSQQWINTWINKEK